MTYNQKVAAIQAMKAIIEQLELENAEQRAAEDKRLAERMDAQYAAWAANNPP